MMKLFIWGESGFIGQLLKKHFKIKHLDVKLIGRGDNCHHVINIAHNTDIPDSIDSNSIIFFLSAISSPDICSNDSSNSKNFNLINTSIVIEKLLQTGATVIFFSSDMIYGSTKKICDESTLPQPNTNYALWKYSIERKFSMYDNFTTLRLSYICDKSDKFTAFLMNTKQNETIKIFDPFYRSMIHSEDFLKVIDLYIEDTFNMPKILNVCGQRCLSRVEYIKAFSDYINLNWEPVVMPNDFKINRPESIIMKSLHLKELISYTWANPGDGILQQLTK